MNIYMIGGPNGAGKTTAALNIMPTQIDCFEYINADSIAAALSPFRPEEVAIEAGRLMLARIKELAQKGEDFSFETTMASRSFAPFLQTCKADGYSIRIVFMWLPSPELSIARVQQRVANGGHHVPEETIRTRYLRGIKNFFELYAPISDYWAVYDNSRPEIRLIAESEQNAIPDIFDLDAWQSIKQTGGQI